MKRGSRQTHDWFAEKVKKLVEFSNEIASTSNLHYEGHPWSIVKLLLLSGWVYVYTTIIPKHFQKYRYVDLLAGTGTTLVKETKDVVVGSAFIPYFFARTPFTDYVFVEKDDERCGALNQRTAKLQGKFQVLEGDCNELVKSALLSENKAHNLVFMDNEGFNASWKTVETVLGTNADILMLFPTSSVSRTRDERTAASLNRFFGDECWSKAERYEDCLQIYVQKLKKQFESHRDKQAYASSVRVGSGNFFYDIILVCRHGPYVRAWDYLKGILNWTDPKIVETTLDFLKGRTTRIDGWFTELDKITSKKDAKPSDTGGTLEPFLNPKKG
jgi:three-Cys-motif partner protein